MSTKDLVTATRIQFRLATADDDAPLRDLLRSIKMEGSVSVSFRREPNYFAAHECEGEFVQVITATDQGTGKIVGIGSRSVRDRYVWGTSLPIGYLSGLRIHTSYRHGTMLARGYRYLRELDADQRARFYVTTIAVDNEPANKVLLGGRAGLPYYKKIGRLITWIVPKRSRLSRRRPRVCIQAIGRDHVPQLLKFIEQVAYRRELIPRYCERDFHFPSKLFAGMKNGDLLGLWMDNELVGTLGVWDQRAMKQVVVEKYDGWLQWLRPFHNLGANILGRIRFPRPGDCLPLVTAALPLATASGEAYFGDLVDEIASMLPNDAEAVMIGLAENDPLTGSVRHRAIQNYQTDIYLVSWNDDVIDPSTWQERVPYLELGAL